MSKNTRKSPSEAPNVSLGNEDDERVAPSDEVLTLPSSVVESGTLNRLVETARDYAKASTAQNTNTAYAADWKHFTRWCRRHGADPFDGGGPYDGNVRQGKSGTLGGRGPCPDPQLIGLYLAELAAPTGQAPALSVSTIDRRLSGLTWNYAQRGVTLDRKDRHIATVLAGIKRKHGKPPVQKEAILPEDILAMVATLPYDLRGLRDRAILLLGYAGGLRRSEIVSLDHGKGDIEHGVRAPDSGGWIEIMDDGAVLTLNAKTGWREVEVGRGSSDVTCPVHALEQWLHFARIDFGPVFVRVSQDGTRALDHRLSDKHVARLIKATVLNAGLRADLPEKDRLALFSGHSLRAGLASSAEIDERYVQKHLGHASAEMTRRYQRRRDRFRVNLTKAAGL